MFFSWDIAWLAVMFFSDAFDFAADGYLDKPVNWSTARVLLLLLGFWVFESTSAVNLEAVAVDTVAGKSWNKPGKICWVWWM